MRFKIGDKVEVMNEKEVRVSWRTAKILSVSGQIYLVQYDSYSGMETVRMVEKVSGKFVRPCPPPVQSVDSCIAGDVVEVFYHYSWKIAVILKIRGCKRENKSNNIHLQAATFQNQYMVRLLECSRELIVGRSNIRMMQTWHDNKWTIMRKISQADEAVLASIPSTSTCCEKMNSQVQQVNARNKYQPKKDCVNIIPDNSTFRESPAISSRSLKRMSPYDSSIIETHNGYALKLRAVEKEGWKQRVVAGQGLDKVDAVAYSREILGEKNMRTSVKIISNGYNKKMEKPKQNDSELGSSDSDASSVGSCSINTQSPRNCYGHFILPPCQDKDTLCSDAESWCGSRPERKGRSLPPKEEVEFSVRKLEMHAYRRTLEALYASGPLSWDKEALLTNLRIMLHITNDEHLKEHMDFSFEDVMIKLQPRYFPGLQLEACIICFQWFKDDAKVLPHSSWH